MKSLEESLLRKALAEGMVSMRYVKKNGETRNAVGTLCLRLIPLDKHPKSPLLPIPDVPSPTRSLSPEGGGPKMPPGLVRYYDFTVQDWRSLYCDEVIEWKRLDVTIHN